MSYEISTYLMSLTTSSLWPLLPDKNDQGKGERKKPKKLHLSLLMWPFSSSTAQPRLGPFPLSSLQLVKPPAQFFELNASTPPLSPQALISLAVQVGCIQIKEVNQVILSYFKLP